MGGGDPITSVAGSMIPGAAALGIGGGSNLVGEITGSNATRDAIAAQTQSAQDANATQRYMYDTTRADLAPWRDAGVRALGGLEDPDFQRDFTMNDFQADPGYQFRMSEGLKALERSAAARGNRLSGATLKGLAGFGQNLASEEYSNAYNRFNADRDRRFNRLSSLAGVGQTAQTQAGQAGQNYANQVSGNQIGLGNSIASANIAQANRTTGLLGQGIAGGALIAASDERLKTNIEPISKEDMQELRATLKPYKFNYLSSEHGDGDWIGVMAQDLEKSKLGKSLVVHDENGFKFIDLKKLACLFLATLAEG